MGPMHGKEARRADGGTPSRGVSHAAAAAAAAEQEGAGRRTPNTGAAGLQASTPQKPGARNNSLSKISLRAVQATCGKGEGVPTVLKWPGAKAKEVFVEGTFTNWNKGLVPLQKQEDEFMVMVYLQPGTHTFRYIVDGQEAIDEGQPKIEHEKGLFNTIVVADQSILSESDEESPLQPRLTRVSKPYAQATAHEKEHYSQTRWVFEESRKLPPRFPPHLRFTPLTSAPTEARQTQESVLPTPYHVTINHMYFQAREDYNVIGSTYRFDEKFATVVYYRSQQESEKQLMHSDPNFGISGSQPIAAPGPAGF